MYLSLIIWLLFGTALLIISINDFLFFRIENEYVLFLLGLYFVSYWFGVTGDNLFFAFKVAAITFVITCILNRYNLIGGGDVKLLFPMLLFSENSWQPFLLGISVGTVILSLHYILFSERIFFFRRKIVISLYVFRKKQNKSVLLNIVLLSLSRINKKAVALKRHIVDVMKQEVPYGIAISCGGFCVIVDKLVVW
jgi:Flp pilus assembly protein protease CpaA